MSVEVGPSHGGPSFPWETYLDGSTPSRGELERDLEARGVQEAGALVERALQLGELELVGGGVRPASGRGGPSRQTNYTKSVSGGFESDIERKVSEFEAEYPERSRLRLTSVDGRSIRRGYAEIERWSWVADSVSESERPASGESVSDVSAVRWSEGVRRLLESYKKTEETVVNLQRGEPGEPGFAEFSVAAECRWMESYQKRYFAQMKAVLREFCGGERPSGGVCEGEFSDPHIAFVSRSASSVPGGDRVSPVDHAVSLRESWESVYHQLRNTLRSKGFVLGKDWIYWRVSEPHTGKRGNRGLNRCYPHEHVVILIDGEVSASDLRPVIEKHVEVCEWAGPEAHDLDKSTWGDEVDTVSVSSVSEVDNLVAYVSDYAAIEPVGLFDRSPEFIGFAAVMDAANMRTVSRSDAASAAASADACKQKYESDRSDQELDHGERVVRSDRSGCRVECAVCGSSHGIDQERTLSEHRLESAGDLELEGREASLRSRWSDARAAAASGEAPEKREQRGRVVSYLENHPGASATEVQGALLGALPPPGEAAGLIEQVVGGVHEPPSAAFERPPGWSVVSVSIAGEECAASGGGGVDMVETKTHDCEMVSARRGNNLSYEVSVCLICEDYGSRFEVY